jgi:hypothetical protein
MKTVVFCRNQKDGLGWKSLKILDRVTGWGLTRRKPGLKYQKFRENLPPSMGILRIYDLKADALS